MPSFLIQGGIPAIHCLNKSGAPEGVSIDVHPTPMQRSAGAEIPLAAALITFGSGVALNLISSWLYDHLKNMKAKRVLIKRREIVIEDKETTIRLIEETIERDE